MEGIIDGGVHLVNIPSSSNYFDAFFQGHIVKIVHSCVGKQGIGFDFWRVILQGCGCGSRDKSLTVIWTCFRFWT